MRRTSPCTKSLLPLSTSLPKRPHALVAEAQNRTDTELHRLHNGKTAIAHHRRGVVGLEFGEEPSRRTKKTMRERLPVCVRWRILAKTVHLGGSLKVFQNINTLRSTQTHARTRLRTRCSGTQVGLQRCAVYQKAKAKPKKAFQPAAVRRLCGVRWLALTGRVQAFFDNPKGLPPIEAMCPSEDATLKTRTSFLIAHSSLLF